MCSCSVLHCPVAAASHTQRPGWSWYQCALKKDEVFWTGVYVFSTNCASGVTAAIRHNGQDGAERVPARSAGRCRTTKPVASGLLRVSHAPG